MIADLPWTLDGFWGGAWARLTRAQPPRIDAARDSPRPGDAHKQRSAVKRGKLKGYILDDPRPAKHNYSETLSSACLWRMGRLSEPEMRMLTFLPQKKL